MDSLTDCSSPLLQLCFSQSLNFFFLRLNQRIKLWHFHGVVPLFVFAEQKQIGFVLWAMAMEEKFVLVDDRLAELLACIAGEIISVQFTVRTEQLDKTGCQALVATRGEMHTVARQRFCFANR